MLTLQVYEEPRREDCQCGYVESRYAYASAETKAVQSWQVCQGSSEKRDGICNRCNRDGGSGVLETDFESLSCCQVLGDLVNCVDYDKHVIYSDSKDHEWEYGVDFGRLKSECSKKSVPCDC